MTQKISRNRVAPFAENILEATSACLLTMVQGNVLALTLSHWLIASQTGLVAGLLASIALLIGGFERRWLVAIVLGTLTMLVDFLVHPREIGPVILEALITGIGAAALSYLVGAAIAYRRRCSARSGSAVS